MPYPDGRFSAVVCFTMLHHIPSIHIGDTLLTLDPEQLPSRLRGAALSEPLVERRDTAFRFRATKPG